MKIISWRSRVVSLLTLLPQSTHLCVACNIHSIRLITSNPALSFTFPVNPSRPAFLFPHVLKPGVSGSIWKKFRCRSDWDELRKRRNFLRIIARSGLCCADIIADYPRPGSDFFSIYNAYKFAQHSGGLLPHLLCCCEWNEAMTQVVGWIIWLLVMGAFRTEGGELSVNVLVSMTSIVLNHSHQLPWRRTTTATTLLCSETCFFSQSSSNSSSLMTRRCVMGSATASITGPRHRCLTRLQMTSTATRKALFSARWSISRKFLA